MLTSEVRPAEARFELTLAFHCAPALAGIKPADLIALPGEGDETDALLASYSASLAGALACVVLWPLAGEMAAMLCGSALVVAVRILSAHFRWNLPHAHD